MSDRNFPKAPDPHHGAQPQAEASGSSASSGSSLPATDERQLVLVKHGQRFIFRYEPGDETRVLAEILEMARDPESQFDAFDAAVLSHQLGVQLSEQLKRLNKAS